MEIKEGAEDDKALIERRVGYRMALAKQISMCLQIEENMTEVSSIIPTLQGALFDVIFYHFSQNNETLVLSVLKEKFEL